ncbi:hypothetical protein CIB48_g10937 [Xylaria polymorpha]|nr:hypothetical protein CIB48_g10937 [Xylaria polymorpha]
MADHSSSRSSRSSRHRAADTQSIRSTRSRATDAQLARRPQGRDTRDTREPREPRESRENRENRDGSSIHETYQPPQVTTNYAPSLRPPSLRSTVSRYSLSSQFAATRQEYDFGFDDASTIGGSTIRSHQVDGIDAVNVPFINVEEIVDIDPLATSPSLEDSDFYDVLYVFETLLDPYRRAKYDLDSYEWGLASTNALDGQESRIAQATRRLAIMERGSGIWELGARFDSRQAANKRTYDPRRGVMGFELADVTMDHAMSIDMTEFDRKFCQMMQRLQRRSPSGDKTTDKGLRKLPIARRLGGTVITLWGSVYGLLQDQVPVSFPSDRHQLSLPHATNRDQFSLLPLVAVNLRHVIPRSYSDQSTTRMVQTSILDNDPDQEAAVVEIESIVLPEPITTIRLSKSIILPFDKQTSFIKLETEQDLIKKRPPRLATTLERPTARGRLLLRIASGDWRGGLDEACRSFAEFTGIDRLLQIIEMLCDGPPDRLSKHIPPRVEIAFKNRGTFESQESRIATRSRNQGIGTLDAALDNDEEGAWTVTTLAEPQYYSVSTKYARDVDADLSALRLQWLHWPHSAPPKHSKSIATEVNDTARRGFCVETEIGTDSLSASYLAFRCLRRVGRLSKLGFEIGLSRYSMHWSVYWSRLGQRINIPFYLSPRLSVDLRAFLLTTLVPFASFTLWELWDQRRRRRRHRQRLEMLQEQQYAYKRRAEADMLTSLMTPAVQSRQKSESSENGLVILNAKYGVKARGAGEVAGWGATEVADVTIPVAALVDHGRLFIPSRVRKSYILGFWDPDPEEEKVLHIRYSYQGRERIVEFRGDDEQLVLPPPSLP